MKKHFSYILLLNISYYLEAQDYMTKFNAHLDSTSNYRWNIKMSASSYDLKFLDSVRLYIKSSEIHGKDWYEIKYAMESVLKIEKLNYSLLHPLLKIYYNQFYMADDCLSFTLNHAFIRKTIVLKKWVDKATMDIYIYDDIISDCNLNHQIRKKMLKSSFLKEDYKNVNPNSYKIFFKECNEGLSINQMIWRTCSLKKRKALKQIKKIVYE